MSKLTHFMVKPNQIDLFNKENQIMTIRKTYLSIIAVVLVALVAIVGTPFIASAQGANANQANQLEFDVAENMYRFVFDQDVVFEEDGFPAHGSSFITEGYIYPKGTLNGSNGVNPDGSPEFPDKVMGIWVCRGWFYGEAAHASSGPWVITEQIFDFGDKLGEETLVTSGWELSDVGEPILRAITGGTGKYSRAHGEAEQIFLGFNATEGVNLTLSVDVKR
jgi:hypothetical protein